MNRWKILTFLMLLGISVTGFGDAPAARPAPVTAGEDPEWLTRFVGDIDGKLRIGIQLRYAKGGATAEGSYFYYKYCKDIRIDAAIDGRNIVIREFDPAGRVTGRFTGRFMEADPRCHFSSKDPLQCEVIAGEWSKPDGSGRRPFYLLADNGICAPKDSCEYVAAGFDDQEAVDTFATKFLQSVKDQDRKAVAAAIDYPVTVTIKGKRKTIKKSADLIKNYDDIFSPALVARLSECPPVHLFSRDQGVMIGSGQIWIGAVDVGKKTLPRVIAVNNEWQPGMSMLDYYGDWKITRVAGFAKVSAMDEKDAAKWIGARVTYSPDVAMFRGPDGNDKCEKPKYEGRVIDADQFREEWREDPKDLGLPPDRIEIIEVKQRGGHGWTCCGGEFIVKSYGSIIVSWDGADFEMNRCDPPVGW
jgi:hypothetical protein